MPEKADFILSKEYEEKIAAKLKGMALVRSMEQKDPVVSIPEFKFIIGCYRIRKDHWFKIAKCLEDKGIILIYRNFRGIKINGYVGNPSNNGSSC